MNILKGEMSLSCYIGNKEVIKNMSLNEIFSFNSYFVINFGHLLE